SLSRVAGSDVRCICTSPSERVLQVGEKGDGMRLPELPEKAQPVDFHAHRKVPQVREVLHPQAGEGEESLLVQDAPRPGDRGATRGAQEEEGSLDSVVVRQADR